MPLTIRRAISTPDLAIASLLVAVTLLSTTVLAEAADTAPIYQPLELPRHERATIQLVAHRGAEEAAPENTFAAARLALAWGAAWVEVDVRTSRDGVMYLMHDTTVDRTTDGTGRFDQLSSDEIDRLDAGSWFDPAYAGEPVPRLRDFLEWAQRRRASIYLDVKDVDPRAFVDLIREMDMRDRVFFWSGDDDLMDEICRLDPDLPHKRGLKTPEAMREADERWGVDITEVNPRYITESFRDEARRLGMRVMANVLRDDEADFAAAVERGAEMANIGRLRRFVRVEHAVLSAGTSASGRGSASGSAAYPTAPFAAADGASLRRGPAGELYVDGSFGHSHNDYYRHRPLTEALDAGMLSIEADVFVRGDDLFVAHDRDEIRRDRTLRSMYLDPLFAVFKELGGVDERHPFGGRVRPGGLPVVLLVDIKNEAEPAWRVLERQLADYPGLFREVHRQSDGRYDIKPAPVIVAVSGQRVPLERFLSHPVRRSGYDGRLADLQREVPAHAMPMISTSFNDLIRHAGGSDPELLANALARFNAAAARHGRLARVWAVPDHTRAWTFFARSGMPLINTDMPAELAVAIRDHFNAVSADASAETSPEPPSSEARATAAP